MVTPYFLRFVNEVDFSQIAQHDKPFLEAYATAVNLSRDRKYGAAARVMWPGREDLAIVAAWMREWEQTCTEEAAKQTLQSLLAPGAEKRLPVPFELALFAEEMAAHRYFWDTYQIFIVPVTILLIVLSRVPLEPLKAAPPAYAAALRTLLTDKITLVGTYHLILDTFRQAQRQLQEVMAAIAAGQLLVEPRVAQAQTTVQFTVSTNGQTCDATEGMGFMLEGAALYDFCHAVRKGLILRRCAWSPCGRFFLPKDGRHRCHSAQCMRRRKKAAMKTK